MSMPAEQINHILSLAELLHGYVDAPDVPVHGIASDSRTLSEGDLFLAVEGLSNHGSDFIDESFSAGLLEYPHYTRPADFEGHVVPEVLRSGDHGKVARWRHAMSLRRTILRRPDLIEKRGGLSDDEQDLLDEFAD